MIIIIGAGITGLTLGEILIKEGVDCTILEASTRPGGNIKTIRKGPYMLESGPNSLIMNDFLYDWLSRLGLGEQVMYASPEAKNRYILKEGTYRELPSGPISLLTNSTISWKAKKQLWRETREPSKAIHHESVDHFFRRRLGDEITDYMVYPFISGIYAGDPQSLLVKEAFPNLVNWEREHGSVLKGFMKSRKVQHHKGTFSFRNGLQQLVDKLSDILAGSIIFNSQVTDIKKSTHWTVCTEDGNEYEAEQVVCTIPAHTLSNILDSIHPAFAKGLAEIYYPAVSQVYLAYKKAAVGHSLSGFGALHNRLEPSNTLGTIFSSVVFPDRCPEDEVLLTAFIGGALTEDSASLKDEEIYRQVLEDHQRFLDISSEPVFRHIVRWTKAIPQYDLNVLTARSYEGEMEVEGFYTGGNWKGGISVGACIKQAHVLAEKLLNKTKCS